ncbi:hypothetical protein GIB67_015894 [Kingdonia uniflora]|uniref:Uncharacterized protein n=1 Tax=Kingdonia uniflora TaxID=39325 RepID=A0A7J7NHH8_9MAGN|nr:hypothetical protein GIB67_015894 [Kingdonia uniflora]
MAGVDKGKWHVSGEEARNNFSKTPGTGSSDQPNPAKPRKMALKYLKKWMLKVLSAFSTTGSGKVAKDKRRRVEPSGESGEKVVEGRSAAVDDLKEVEERARLVVLNGEEDTRKMVETKANLDEMVEERDKLGHHLMLKGYFEEEVELDSSRSRENDVLMYNREFLEQFDRMKEANENREDQYLKGHVQKGNVNLRECQHKLDAALIREKVLEGEIKAKELLVKRKEELLKDIPAREELNAKIQRLRARVVDLEAMCLAELTKLESRLEKVRVKFAVMVTPDASHKGCICGAKIDRGNYLGVMETQLGPRTAELIELGRAVVIYELKVRPLDVGGSTADSTSAEKKPL